MNNATGGNEKFLILPVHYIDQYGNQNNQSKYAKCELKPEGVIRIETATDGKIADHQDDKNEDLFENIAEQDKEMLSCCEEDFLIRAEQLIDITHAVKQLYIQITAKAQRIGERNNGI